MFTRLGNYIQSLANLQTGISLFPSASRQGDRFHHYNGQAKLYIK